jgi:hypothetical protein
VSFFTRGSDPHSPHELVGVDVGFIFQLWVTREYPKFQILMISVQPAQLNFRQAQSFSPTQQYLLLMPRTVTLGAVILLTNPVLLLVL